MEEKVILSGMRPTGSTHLGNYFGALSNWIKYQDEYKGYYFIADWHALTTEYENTDSIKENTFNMAVDWLSAGLDPAKNTIFVQSMVPEHSELFLIFSMITPLSWLERCPTYKSQLTELSEKNISTYGFLGYPCLQAADILLYKADAVPVGEDQLPHVELTREIGRRFNFLYEDIFPEPKSLMTKTTALPGIDGRKMSKSYNNTIAISDSPDEVAVKVRGMITDPARIKKDDPGHPDICIVYAFQKVFNEGAVEDLTLTCKKGEIGCVQCKKNLIESMQGFFEPIHEKRQQYLNNKDLVYDILEQGRKAASIRAKATLEEVRRAIKI
jgi:tryptophanyl-tRNA synthetase